MGDFRITVNAVGGHGCERETKDGGKVYGCGRMNCPDCITAKYVAELARAGAMVKDAAIEHWPGTDGQVTDVFNVSSTSPPNASSILVPRTRRGSFP